MVGVKFNAHHLRKAYQNVKPGIMSGYHHVKNVSEHVDHAVNIGKKIYHAVEPLINRYAENHHKAINDHAVHGLTGYESMGNKVSDANDHVQQTTGHLKNNLPPLM